jgi:hypothetical protein
VDSVAAGVVSNSLSVVSGGGGDYSARTFFGGEREKFVQGSTLLESSGALLIVELEEDGIIGECREGFRISAGGKADGVADTLAGSLDVLKPNHQG